MGKRRAEHTTPTFRIILPETVIVRGSYESERLVIVAFEVDQSIVHAAHAYFDITTIAVQACLSDTVTFRAFRSRTRCVDRKHQVSGATQPALMVRGMAGSTTTANSQVTEHAEEIEFVVRNA